MSVNKSSVMVAVRDGTRLATTVFLPDGDGPWPTMLLRSPYGFAAMGPDMFEQMARDGYVAIHQDERGRFESEGVWAPREYSGRDGADTCDWIARQPWSNGKIGLFGASYTGITQWLTAMESPASVKSMSPCVAGDTFADCPYISPGVLSMSVIFGWAIGNLGPDTCRRSGLMPANPYVANCIEAQDRVWTSMRGMYTNKQIPESDLAAQAQSVQQLVPHIEALYGQSLSEIVKAVDKTMPWVREWIEHPEPEDPYWSPIDWSQHFDKVKAPALIVAGWYDLFVRSAPRDFAEMAKRDHSDKMHKLVIGPWPHSYATNLGAIYCGQRQFPWSAVSDSWSLGGTSVSQDRELMKRWHAHWLEGEDNGITDGAPIKIYVMGENVLRDEHEWPLSRTQWTNFYLHSDGNANTSAGDGALSIDEPGGENADCYHYDPSDPVPTVGGRTLDFHAWGSFDQREVEKREDVLVYSTAALEEAVEVTGPIVLKLWAATSAVDTDFTAKLVDVQPEGPAYNLCEGITRLRFRKGQKGLVTPGALQQVTIELGPTSNLFLKGHRIRVEVSSSNFPYADPNPNTGKSLFLDESNEMVVAEQTVYHDTSRPSHVTLPIIPR